MSNFVAPGLIDGAKAHLAFNFGAFPFDNHSPISLVIREFNVKLKKASSGTAIRKLAICTAQLDQQVGALDHQRFPNRNQLVATSDDFSANKFLAWTWGNGIIFHTTMYP